MAGKVTLFHMLQLITSNPGIMGYLILFLAQIGAIFIYFITKNLFNNKQIALYALILYVFIPAKLLFSPILNIFLPTLILGAFFLFIKYLKQNKDIYLLLLGPCVYLVFFLEPLPLVMGLLFIAFLQKKNIKKIIAYPIMTFLATHLFMIIFLKYNIFTNFFTILNIQFIFNPAERPYLIWLLANLKNFFMNAGLLSSIIFVMAIIFIIKKLSKQRIKYLKESSPLITIGLVIILLVLDISGITRGEVSRVWIFLMAFIQIPIAWHCYKNMPERTFYLIVLANVLQTCLTISMLGFVIPFHLIPLA